MLKIATSCRMRDKIKTWKIRVFKPKIKNQKIRERKKTDEITLNRSFKIEFLKKRDIN